MKITLVDMHPDWSLHGAPKGGVEWKMWVYIVHSYPIGAGKSSFELRHAPTLAQRNIQL